jgi:hypothetical protein
MGQYGMSWDNKSQYKGFISIIMTSEEKIEKYNLIDLLHQIKCYACHISDKLMLQTQHQN